MKKIPIIIDCDTGIDDMISFALTLSSEKLNILGITTVAGNQTVENTTRNTLNGLTLMGREDIPVAKGESKPLERPLRNAGYIHGETGLGRYHFPVESKKEVVSESAEIFISSILNTQTEKVVILALAPLTNIAKLIQDYPNCIDKIDKIVFMGGAIRTGNPTPVATFNVLADPEAAKIVMNSGIPFHMCPLDTTRELYLTDEQIDMLGTFNNPVADMNKQLCRYYKNQVDLYNQASTRFKGLCIHDLCAAAYVTNPELFTTSRYQGDVETDGELTSGFTVIDYEDIRMTPEEKKNITFIDSVDRNAVLKLYFDALTTFGGKND